MGKLEEKYVDVLAVIGVQSAKYPTEGVPEDLRSAVARLDIKHPVVNDPDYVVWDSFAVNAWPTLIFLSPGGKVIGRHAGEVSFEALDGVLEALVTECEAAGTLQRGPLPYSVSSPTRALSVLSFPGKVLATEDRLLIADSGHHRVLEADFDGAVRRIFGCGEAGLIDGDASEARFYRPQGMAEQDGLLYVADSENHAIRAIDLQTGRVRTVAGTGSQAVRRIRRGPALETDLSSPWDVAAHGSSLYIAMAGLHQVWLLDTAQETVRVWAGTGHEAIRDGPRESAWFAQPMGVALDAGAVYTACAESQAIRRIDRQSGEVSTLAGSGLFAFGDADGPPSDALLQHCQGVTTAGGRIIVADTYNHRIKAIEPNGTIQSILGSGRRGHLDGPGPGARFDEPGGVCMAGDTLWIADTNNHLIRWADLAGGSVHTLELRGEGIEVHRP